MQVFEKSMAYDAFNRNIHGQLLRMYLKGFKVCFLKRPHRFATALYLNLPLPWFGAVLHLLGVVETSCTETTSLYLSTFVSIYLRNGLVTVYSPSLSYKPQSVSLLPFPTHTIWFSLSLSVGLPQIHVHHKG